MIASLSGTSITYRARPGDRFGGHGLQHFLVHISEFLDVDTALASGVLAEFWQQRFRTCSIRTKLLQPCAAKKQSAACHPRARCRTRSDGCRSR